MSQQKHRYQAALRVHLSHYAKRRLGVFEGGTFKSRLYPHILPYRLRFLNLLESFRAEIQDYLEAHKEITLHQYFHHLNSSQAFALNLFYPYFVAGGADARALSASIGIDAEVSADGWGFEGVPDIAEGTNVDVVWRTLSGGQIYCEVKLSETGFGTAKNDDRHKDKLKKIYRPKLEPLVSSHLLENKVFFANYQILRNVALLANNKDARLVFLLPRGNESLHLPLQTVLAGITPAVQNRISVAHVEDCLNGLTKVPSLSMELRLYAEKLKEKYIPLK